MSIKLTDTTLQYISWGAIAPVQNLALRTFCLRANINAYHARTGWMFTLIPNSISDEWWSFGYRNSDDKIVLIVGWSTAAGVWTIAKPSTGVWHSFIISYNKGSTANNPVIYIDGISVTVTRATAPSGTYRSGTGSYWEVGADDGTNVLDGYVEDLRYYNVIKSAAQASVIASENIHTSATIDESGLVFHAPLTMCKGLTYPTFAGSVLGAANTFFDRINGYLGVPSGSPVGA